MQNTHTHTVYLLQCGTELGLVLGAGSLSFQPQQQLWFPVGFESQQVDDALSQWLVGCCEYAAIPPIVG